MLHLFSFPGPPSLPFPTKENRVAGKKAARVPGGAAARAATAPAGVATEAGGTAAQEGTEARGAAMEPDGDGDGVRLKGDRAAATALGWSNGGPSGDGARRSSGERAEWSGSGATRSSLGSPDGSPSLQLASAKSLSPLLAGTCCFAQRRRAAALLS